MCDKVVSEDLFLIVYCPDKYKLRNVWKAVDDSLGALKLIPNWFVTSKTIKKLFTSLYVDKNILYFNEDSSNVKFSCNEMGILNIEILIIILIIILSKLILILLCISDFWPGILNLETQRT